MGYLAGSQAPVRVHWPPAGPKKLSKLFAETTFPKILVDFIVIDEVHSAIRKFLSNDVSLAAMMPKMTPNSV